MLIARTSRPGDQRFGSTVHAPMSCPLSGPMKKEFSVLRLRARRFGVALTISAVAVVSPTLAGATTSPPAPTSETPVVRTIRDCDDLVAAARARDRRHHHHHHHHHHHDDDDECGPPPTVPEVPLIALLPLTGAGITAVAFVVTRRQHRLISP